MYGVLQRVQTLCTPPRALLQVLASTMSQFTNHGPNKLDYEEGNDVRSGVNTSKPNNAIVKRQGDHIETVSVHIMSARAGPLNNMGSHMHWEM